jgi:hypothetical protein
MLLESAAGAAADAPDAKHIGHCRSSRPLSNFTCLSPLPPPPPTPSRARLLGHRRAEDCCLRLLLQPSTACWYLDTCAAHLYARLHFKAPPTTKQEQGMAPACRYANANHADTVTSSLPSTNQLASNCLCSTLCNACGLRCEPPHQRRGLSRCGLLCSHHMRWKARAKLRLLCRDTEAFSCLASMCIHTWHTY